MKEKTKTQESKGKEKTQNLIRQAVVIFQTGIIRLTGSVCKRIYRPRKAIQRFSYIQHLRLYLSFFYMISKEIYMYLLVHVYIFRICKFIKVNLSKYINYFILLMKRKYYQDREKKQRINMCIYIIEIVGLSEIFFILF